MITADIQTLRQRATKFAKDYADAYYEMGEAQSFIIDLGIVNSK